LRELVNSLSADVTISHHFDFIQACATLPKTEDTTRFSGVEFSTLTYQWLALSFSPGFSLGSRPCTTMNLLTVSKMTARFRRFSCKAV